MLIDLKETIDLIQSGKLLHIAADEALLAQLPAGSWIGGTTPYFMSEKGGMISEDKLLVEVFDFPVASKIAVYDEKSIYNIAAEAYDNGFTLLILPFGSKILETYAKDAPGIDQLFFKNIAGWVSGFNLEKSDGKAKVFDGSTLKSYDDKAVALHIEIAGDRLATLEIINIFEPDPESPVIEFYGDSFEAEKCSIDGVDTGLAAYLKENKIDTKLPLVADFSGANINISFKEIAGDAVKFYAPVFQDVKYRFAKKIDDYIVEFEKSTSASKIAVSAPAFSCNCILNYLYGNLDGKTTAPFLGPVTFGEVAFQLVNQTLVYVTIQ